ncbi:hypothetical protein BS412_14740 [Cronobacter turicensis]|uniref:Uncharacterized protein n=2 Tax=Cronobacter turicensis TaxID=413502 RepID=A0A2T7B6X7_9ENTR|nr:hypothetical protein [Cronobacter turicensis]PUX23649.1 hypothetical protein BS411_06935 [Cronobacter turicensis]PUX33052.1 hypothetical protein BS412_14740 [Cronobacter turicensis]
MRLFNPVALTEVIPGIHDVSGAVELPETHWFFKTQQIPEGSQLTVNDNGEPILVSIDNTENLQAN